MTRHLYVDDPVTVAHGQINDSFAGTYPVADIPIKSVTGDLDTVAAAGMTVIFGTTAGADDLGRSYVRKVIGSENLYIGYSAQGTHDGEIDIAVNSYFAILDDRRVWAKPQRFITQEVEPFTITYKDYDFAFASHGSGTQFYPKANAGPWRAGTIDSGTGLLTVEFDASDSYSVPLGVGITTYLWDLNGGTITVGTTATAAITATFPAGRYWVSLTVTDTNGLQHTMYVLVLARDPDADVCVEVWHADIERTEQGQRASVRIYSDLPVSTYPDGATVLIFDDEQADHECEFIGWIQTEPASVEFVRTGALRDTTLECLDLAHKLDTLPGQSQVISHAATPANWSEMFQPEMLEMIDYLLRWHSTAMELADFSLPALDAGYGYAFVSREAAANSLYRQVQEQARSICPDHNFGTNMAGQMCLRIDPLLIASLSRTATVQATLNGHIHSFSFVRQRPPRYQWIRGGAVVEGWTMIEGAAQDVEYIIRPTTFHDVGVTSISVFALPVALADNDIIYLRGAGDILLPYLTVAAAALVGATSITVDTTTDTVSQWDELVFVQSEPGPDVIATVFAVAPGLTPGQGTQTMTVNGKLCLTQGGLNSMLGHLYERLNAPYSVFDVELADEDLLGVDPVEKTWVTADALAVRYLPQRAHAFWGTDTRLLPLEVSVSLDSSKQGTVRVGRLRLEIETVGVDAVTLTSEEA
jgi:PKD repeat protein